MTEKLFTGTLNKNQNKKQINLGLYVNDLLENCTIFGTTIFLDRRENAPIGENGF